MTKLAERYPIINRVLTNQRPIKEAVPPTATFICQWSPIEKIKTMVGGTASYYEGQIIISLTKYAEKYICPS
jgi:hypothetical protein